MIGDPRVGPQQNGREVRDKGRDLFRGDVEDARPCSSLVGVLSEEGHHHCGITGCQILRAAIQARQVAVGRSHPAAGHRRTGRIGSRIGWLRLWYRSRRGETQVAYTWGHSIDDQSDPLQGNFDDLQPTRASNTNLGDNRAGFTRQFQSGADRASSDFDQRQNLVLYTIWELGLPRRNHFANSVLNNWQVAGIAGFRSGFPFNVISSSTLQACPGSGVSSDTEILRNRPSLIPGRSPFLAHPIPVPGGYQLLDPSAFCDPGPTEVGNLGRNALVGPGFWNVDLSLVKSFRPRKLGDSGAIQLRADFFNAFNHANLGSPDGLAADSTFGQAMLGRQGVQPSFPSQIPLDQLARQVQLQIKVLF